MRILFTAKKRGWNGETAHIQDLVRGCLEGGHEVLLGARPDAELSRRLTPLGVELLPLELIHDVRAVGALLRDLRALRATLRGVDLVHCHASWDTWLTAWERLGLGGSPPLLRTRHSLKRIARHPANRWLYGHAIDRLLAGSRTIAADLARYPFIAPDRVLHVPCGVDTDRFDPARFEREAARRALREQIAAEPDALVAAYVGRVVPRKQPEVFVEAAARLREARPDARFLVVGPLSGEGDWARSLRRRIEALAPQVQALDFVEDVPRLLLACDAFVLPAPAEPFGLAPVEAMAMGCPPVCADAAGLAESVADGATGLLFPPGDAGACAERLERLLSSPALRAQLARAGRERVVKQFGVDRTWAAYRAVCERLCAGSASGATDQVTLARGSSRSGK